MKAIIATLSLFISLSATAIPFEAEVKGDTLSVTIEVDGCNSYGVSLEVDPLCRSDRRTKNYALSCSANLIVMSTMMACSPPKQKAFETFDISLKQSKVAPEAEELTIEYFGDSLTLKLPGLRMYPQQN